MAKLPAGARRRSDGLLEKRFTVNGKRYSVYAATAKDLADKEQTLRKEIEQGQYTANRNITLNKFFELWIDQKRRTVKTNSVRLYKSHYNNHIKDQFGNKKIKSIERREVIEFQSKLLQTMQPASVNHVIAVLVIILHDAVKEQIIAINPASDITPIRSEAKATETIHRALTKEEQEIFMQALKDNYYYSFIALMLATGMRQGEVGALTWADIDYNNNVIHVNKTLTMQEDSHVITGNSAKSKAGMRDIPLNPISKQILADHKAKSSVLPFTNRNIFLTPRGNHIVNRRINKAIEDTVKALNADGYTMQTFTSHALRDTFATRYIEQGGNMYKLQKILGHKSITMTMDLYAHVLPDELQDEMQTIHICV